MKNLLMIIKKKAMNHKPGSVKLKTMVFNPNSICLGKPLPVFSGSLPAFYRRTTGAKDSFANAA